jgi:hypothetical protein
VSEAIGALWFPALIAAAVLLSRRWPIAMRRVSRGLALAVGAALLCIVVSGLAHGSRPAGAIHRWLSHGLLILAWNAIPLAIGVTLARVRARPIIAAGRILGLLLLLVILFVASFTGYLGPSQGPIDARSLTRFRVLHYGLWPSVSIALVVWWSYDPESDRGPRSRARGEIPAEVEPDSPD